MASECSCRAVLERLSEEFFKDHLKSQTSNKSKTKNVCEHIFRSEESISAILRHMNECILLTKSTENKLGDKISNHLQSKGIQPASRGGYFQTFQSFCKRIHGAELLKTDEGQVVVPSSLSHEDKRFMIRYLIGDGYDFGEIVVCGPDGTLRPPKDEEVTTPPKKRQIESALIGHTPVRNNRRRNL